MAVAESGQASIIDVERLVRSFACYAGQDSPPPDDKTRKRDVKIRRGDDGTGRLIVTLGDLELEEFAAAFQAFLGPALPAPPCGRVFSRGLPCG